MLVIDASNEYKEGKNQNVIEDSHIEKIVKKLAAQHGNYVLTVKNLEDKYRKIELEANGHFSAFVTQIRSQYAVKPGYH